MNQVKSILIDEAQPEQLRTYATQFLNLDVAPDATDTAVRSAIDAAQPGGALIFVMEEPDDEAREQAEATRLAAAPDVVIAAVSGDGDRQVGTLGHDDPRYIINIPIIETEDESGTMDVEVGVNGRAWQIKRGVDASVPARVVEALRNAKGQAIRHVPDTHGNVDVVVNDFQRHGFNVIESPSKAELDEWHRQTDALFCA